MEHIINVQTGASFKVPALPAIAPDQDAARRDYLKYLTFIQRHYENGGSQWADLRCWMEKIFVNCKLGNEAGNGKLVPFPRSAMKEVRK